MAPKKGLILQRPKSSKNATLPYENLIFVVPRPSKIVPKSMPKCLLNRLRLGYPLASPKNTIFDHKRPPRWSPEISDFFQKSSKNRWWYCLLCQMPFESLQEPLQSRPWALKRPSRAFKSLPLDSQEVSERLVCRAFCILGQRTTHQRQRHNATHVSILSRYTNLITMPTFLLCFNDWWPTIKNKGVPPIAFKAIGGTPAKKIRKAVPPNALKAVGGTPAKKKRKGVPPTAFKAVGGTPTKKTRKGFPPEVDSIYCIRSSYYLDVELISKKQCRHGGGSTRQRSWIIVRILFSEYLLFIT